MGEIIIEKKRKGIKGGRGRSNKKKKSGIMRLQNKKYFMQEISVLRKRSEKKQKHLNKT